MLLCCDGLWLIDINHLVTVQQLSLLAMALSLWLLAQLLLLSDRIEPHATPPYTVHLPNDLPDLLYHP